ncbi:TOMM system kinase/cyclase fusion protein [Hyalangium gracile]|uniref:TOMM system kinase/cyclase fusion protein n=1 Tax=Hyalangium gracile TaxID=394092 RepID=UPI001CCB8558|nr:TOMM system kinase/cyclase fusion protein [Hyalangium gracile]
MFSIAAGTVFQERYEILSKLGEGGFSQVYRARQKATGQEVAVKVLHFLHTGDEGLTARFQREMRLCARLYHPHIVRLIDSGSTEDGQLYTVFEYVPGRTLGDVLASEGALPPWEAAHLMLQVLDALGCAHKLGIVHRDLKPQNIMLTSTGVRRNSLVLDFGLGTLSDEDRREDLSRITRTRDTLGTPAYAAPEQLRGEPVTARTDLYAWGLIFLECLTGKRVVEGTSLQELVFKQLGSEPIPLPVWLEGHRLGRLLRRATEKDPKARDVTAQDLLLELEACVTQGWPSTEAGVPQSVVTPTHVPAEGERRQLTALCCGLRLAGEGADTADVEDLDAMLWTQHAAAIELARRREAWLGSVLGERLLLYFGYPQAQEDDALRAAHVALELKAELEQRSAQLARVHGVQLEVRVGLHTGLVIGRELRGEGIAGLPVLTGTTPGIAERLEALAQPGEILVSEVTAKVLRENFTLEPSGEHRVGSGTRPVAVFRLRDRQRVSASGLEGTPTGPMFGRTLERELLVQRWRQVVAGMGQGILITGEPGIGKTRLTQELAQQARATPHTFLECRCAPEWRNSTLRPVVDLLERMLGVGRDSTSEQITVALEKLLTRYGFELREFVPLFASLFPLKGTSDRYPQQTLSPQRQKEEILGGLLALIFEMAQQQPVLLVVEDLHWADPMTLELVTLLLKDASSARLCAVLTARPSFVPPWPSNQALQMQLSRLERPQVEEMVRRLTREAPLPREVVEQVVGRTDGVPLFVEELTRMVVESLARQGDAPGRESIPLAIPSTLRDSLMARLDRLGPTKGTLQLAAALGREFSYEVLEAAFPSSPEALKKDMDVLVAADLVHRRRGTRNPTYAFKHALIRDTAYESMVKPLRRQVHARIAAALEQRFPELAQQRPDLLARHYAAGDKKQEALVYAHKAALAALMRSADHEALSHATEALGWLDAVKDVRERARWELDLNGVITPAVMATRGWSDPSVKERVERSQALIDLLGNSPHVVPTLWALVNFHHLRAQHAQARGLVERLVSMEGLAEDVGHQIVVLPLKGDCLCAQGRFAEARECTLRALSFDAGTQPRQSLYLYGIEPRIYARLVLALAKWHLGLPDKAARMMETALALARELNHASTQAVAYIFALGLYLLREDHARHAELAEQAKELMERQRFSSQGAYCEVMRCWGKRDLEGMERALAMLDEQGSALLLPFYSSLAAQVEASLGRTEAATARLEGALRQARATDEGFSIFHVLIRLGSHLLETAPDPTAGEAYLREALALARERQARMLELRAALPLCRLLLRMQQRAEARELLVPLYGQFTEGLDAPDLVRARALIEELGGA